MISVKKSLPQIGESVVCQVRFWRHGTIHHEETVLTVFLGVNPFTHCPMFGIEAEEAYPEVTHWKSVAESNRGKR